MTEREAVRLAAGHAATCGEAIDLTCFLIDDDDALTEEEVDELLEAEWAQADAGDDGYTGDE